MIFYRFVRACKKYKFTFVLSTYGKVTLILRPVNTFKNIELEEDYYDLRSILLRGIKTMREYRENGGC